MKNFIIVLTFLVIGVNVNSQESNELSIGDEVSHFSAFDDQGNVWKSSDLNSDFLVVYFYPAAMTGGCTKQACAYRDDKTSLDELGASVVAVSGDEVKNLKIFKESYQLNFPLLSDNEGNISKLFGVPTNIGGSITREINGENFLLNRGITAPRWTFVLDKNRKIIYKNAEVNAEEDSNNVKKLIKEYSK
jgi:peroxiredoxin Q/BCP